MWKAIAFVFTVASVCAAVEAGAKETPAPPRVFELAGVKVECSDIAVTGIKDGEEVWTFRYPSLAQREREPAHIVDPVAVGDRLYYGVASYLLVLDAKDGRIARRVIMPGTIKNIRAEGAGVVVTVSRKKGDEVVTAEYVVAPGQPDPPLVFPVDWQCPWTDALSAVEKLYPAFARIRRRSIRPPRRKEAGKRLENAAAVLTESADRDPTNPFLHVLLGESFFALRRPREGREAFGAALEVEGNSRFLLIYCVEVMERRGLVELADEAIDAGYKLYVGSGGKPEEFKKFAGVQVHPPVAFDVSGVTVKYHTRRLHGYIEGKRTWTIRHPSVKSIYWETRRAPQLVPAGGLLYYAVGSNLLVLDPVKGRITRRVLFSEEITRIRPEGEGVRVTVHREETWEKREMPEHEYLVEPGSPDPQLFLGGSLRLAVSAARDAEDVNYDFGSMPVFQSVEHIRVEEPELLAGEARARAELAIPALTEQAERDPTNPFWYVELGKRLFDLGRTDEARAAFEKTLEVEGHLRIFLLRAATAMEVCGFTNAAEKAFEKGYRCYLESGHEPELFMCLIGLMIHVDTAASAVTSAIETGELDRAAHVLERVWKIAPIMEGTVLAYAGMADEFSKAGREVEAEKWRERASVAVPCFVFGWVYKHGTIASLGLNLYAASVLALLLYVAFLVVKYGPLHHKEYYKASGFLTKLKTAYLPLYMKKVELLALVLLCVLPFVGEAITAPSVCAIANSAATDLAATNGSFGSPEALVYWEDYALHEEGKEIYAVGLIQAGRLDEAEAILKSLADSPEARSNLGVVLARKGKPEEARAAFEAALELNPRLPEAAYNLGRQASGTRVERARKYLPGRKLLAVPSLQTFGTAMKKGRDKPPEFEGMHGLLGAISSFSGQPPGEMVLWILQRVLLVIVGIPALVLLFMKPSRKKAEPYGTHWWLSLTLPGSSAWYAPLGVLFLVTFLYSGFVLKAHAALPGSLSIIDAISIPSMMLSFGVSGELGSVGWRDSLITACWILVFAVPVVSALGVATLRFVKPEAPDDVSPPPSFAWLVIRAALFLAAGLYLVLAFSNPALRVPGVILVLAAVASAVAAFMRKAPEAPAQS